jgi:hypothetical protein
MHHAFFDALSNTMKTHNLLKAIALAAGIAGSAHGAQIDVINDTSLTEFDAALGVRILKQNQTWTKDNQYILKDRLFIKNGQTLTIAPGTKVYGSTNPGADLIAKGDDLVGSIIACRGGRLVADGTITEPILFTAIQQLEADTSTDLNGDSIVGPAPTSSTGGLWGGIVLLGNAYVSQSSSTGTNIGKAEIEGFLPLGTPDTAPNDGLADATTYGFDATFARDDADNSGIIRYVSIRHGGYEFAAGKEINGLTMGGVGRGTIVEFVEVYSNTDDGFEWFGGTGSTRNLVSAFNQDDSFDFDSGHTGTHQFLFAVQNPGFADGGMELDGIESSPSNSTNQAAGFNAGLTPSKPIFYNLTLIGPGRTNTKSTIAARTGQVLTEKGNHALIIEDYFNGEFYNSVFHDFTQDLAIFRDNATSTGATPAAAHNTVGAFGDATVGSNTSYITNTNSKGLFYNSFGTPQRGNSNGGTAPLLRTYTRSSSITGTFLTALDPRLSLGSPSLASNGATLQTGAPISTAFRGAFGDNIWAAGWSAISQSGVLIGQNSNTLPTDITTFKTSQFGSVSLANFFIEGAYANATVVPSSLPAGLIYDSANRTLNGYPTSLPSQANFRVTQPDGSARNVQLIFNVETIPANIVGTYALQTPEGDNLTITIGPQARANGFIRNPGQVPVAFGPRALTYDESAVEKWSLSLPTRGVSIVFPTIRTYNETNSMLVAYGSYNGKPLRGFKAAGTLGSIKLKKGNDEVTITGVLEAGGQVAFTLTQNPGSVVARPRGFMSVDGICNISGNFATPGLGAFTGMLRVEEEFNESGFPTGRLVVALLQGFDGWEPVEYIAP